MHAFNFVDKGVFCLFAVSTMVAGLLIWIVQWIWPCVCTSSWWRPSCHVHVVVHVGAFRVGG